ncbi:4-hydroxybutyrate dehydrogenase [Aequitasia blattaphilus]|uniref:Iron-containing alcohol dehydrogenase n=1 Tax=Aequitasia blattaphilus TaxID=2949332 RepID=A0ABT1EA09_9FIRM|nr:iron-containing alcohol dehydrogenase [Aequitasia blattaphilus]MCP1102680.1 iron-containing alcohol dehydrogenase [Aequitasia blattaphilus]MCR8615320.1 iron-containing alcohol dehydrogenase [Aequitasia blattaphilus]
MSFSIKPTIAVYDSLKGFMEEKQVGEGDLIVTNEYVLSPQLGEAKAPCAVLYQEKYGQGEPSDEMVDAILKDIKGKNYKRIIAIGGGTIIDISKLLRFNDDYNVEEIYAKGVDLVKERELIVIPTTCGTGSEVTNISILEFKKKKTKMGLAVPQLFADEAALVPKMLSTLPYGVFATSSIDALVHAMESYVSPKATAFSRMFGKAAMEKILNGYQKMQKEQEAKLPADMEDFLIASTMAGVAFGNAGCAAVHALAYPIGAIYHVPHGKANHMVFEATFNMYKELGADLSPVEEVLAEIFNCSKEESWKQMFDLLDFVLKRESLGSIGVDEKIAEEMAASVIENQQRLLANNPIELSQEQIKIIYERCIK